MISIILQQRLAKRAAGRCICSRCGSNVKRAAQQPSAAWIHQCYARCCHGSIETHVVQAHTQWASQVAARLTSRRAALYLCHVSMTDYFPTCITYFCMHIVCLDAVAAELGVTCVPVHLVRKCLRRSETACLVHHPDVLGSEGTKQYAVPSHGVAAGCSERGPCSTSSWSPKTRSWWRLWSQ